MKSAESADPSAWHTLSDMFRSRADAEPDRLAFTFLDSTLVETGALTLRELDRRARAIAVRLRADVPVGGRALLTYQAGLDFVTAFVGCLHAGVVAVPVPALESGRGETRNRRVSAIARSSGAEAVLCAASGHERAVEWLRESGIDAPAIATDEVGTDLAESWLPPEIDADSLAYLQYSSGSTGEPKGVELTHSNVITNLALIRSNGTIEGDDHVPPSVQWLPLFHDMGLVNGVLQPTYEGYDVVLMSPFGFVQRPVSWLRVITKLGEAISAAPNFALDLCVRRVTDRQREELDLSGLRMVALGAEPIRAETLDRFCAAFEPCGFQRKALFPCYGLAESTVMVSGGPAWREPVILSADAQALELGRVKEAEPGARARRLVGCGQVHSSIRLVVADPATGEPAEPDAVGEILVSGPSIGRGYWNAPEQTGRTFGAKVPGEGDREFLRTGDLGFVHNGQLFITGRLKDVIILDGHNHYPHDIESTATTAHPALRPEFCCAFSVDDGEQERLVVLAELASGHRVNETGEGGDRMHAVEDVRGVVRKAITAEHGVAVHEVVLLPTGSLPFTSSGKLQRRECVQRYERGDLPSAVWS
ncbi:fatty acyl-AMP ligase [Allokutzneria sp. A3M-2-11 16]|uniref:fatty acyl-AMP ligase n=1 Tax=Allokutzneria sp. A3M-2-11 16 TaxID=2962043 RepID=UPI0020B82FFE|nr:fatty acyl-AMP ligase [Allokutzneria sp. A3M-2-11 16]MCP3805303.1 fatty acyl-AMP ligase [Allokutzneria sp. A3M-2-11 16]